MTKRADITKANVARLLIEQQAAKDRAAAAKAAREKAEQVERDRRANPRCRADRKVLRG